MHKYVGHLAVLALIGSAGTALGEDFAGCSDGALRAQDMVGNWTIDGGMANVSGAPMGGGGDPIVLTQAAGNLTATIEGRRITLRADTSGQAPDWTSGQLAPMSADEMEVLVGCPLADLPRWSGQGTVSAQGRTATVTWSLMGIDTDWAILQYALVGPPNAHGYFSIVQ